MKKFTLPFIVALTALLFTCPYLMADEEPDYFTIKNNYSKNTRVTSATDLCKIYLSKNGTPTVSVTLQYRIISSNGTISTWQTFPTSSSTAPNLKTGESLQLRGNNVTGLATDGSKYYYLYVAWKTTNYNGAWSYTSTGNKSGSSITVPEIQKGVLTFSGNLMSLVAFNSETNTINDNMQLPDYCFYDLFRGMAQYIGNAENLKLPATNLSKYCYCNLFYNAYNMLTCPNELPATSLPIACYKNMFYCNNQRRPFSKAPDIKATSYSGTDIQTLSDNAMFFTASISSANDKLNSMRVYRTTWNTSYTSNWVQGVQTTAGSFYCPPQLSRERGINRIPTNWTVYSYDLTFHLQSGAWTDETSEDRQYTWRTDVSDVTTFLTNEVAAGTRFYSDAACTSELTQSNIESQLSELQNTTTWTIYVNGGTAPAGASTYTVTLADDATGYGSVDATEISEVEDEANITIDGNTLTIGTTTVTATPTTADAQYTHTFTGWTDGEGNSLPATLTGDLAVVAHFSRTTNTYAIRFLNGEKVLQNTQVEYGTTPAYDGSTPTKDADNEYTYTFNAWTPAIYSVDKAQDYTATFTQTKQQYTLTWVTDGNELTGSYTTGTMDWGASITAPDTPTKPGKDFAGWRSSISSNVEDPASTMPTQDLTYTATWTDAAVRTLDLYDDRDATYYNNIKALNDQTYDVTYHRSVAYTSDNGNARWYTLCLPFDVDQSQLDLNGLTGKVYEYRYAEGSADENDHVTFHFRAVKSPNLMLAGQGYLVKATGNMGPNFTFTGVTINTSADTQADVNDLKGVNAYYDQSVGSDIAIVGVLRNGTLSADGRKVMGLANNKIWYPHSSGNPMPAYRAYFYNPSASASVMPRVRIVVEGEGETELEVVDGELYDASGNDADGDIRDPRKYIRNGVLIIERNGVRYDAQGKRL